MLNIQQGYDINVQMNLDLYYSIVFTQRSSLCKTHKLEGCAAFHLRLAQRYREQMQALSDYLIENGVTPCINPVPDPAPGFDYPDLYGMFKLTYADEETITTAVTKLVHAALTTHDYMTFNFLQDYVARQRKYAAIVNSVKVGPPLDDNNSNAMYIDWLDQKLLKLEF